MNGSAPHPLIHPGPWLLAAPHPDLATHRDRHRRPPRMTAEALAELADRAAVLGRGGAGFPLARKLRTAAAARSWRRHVVVNLSEGEPASAKDLALALTAPHLVLDGALLAAQALGSRRIDLVVPGEAPAVERALATALGERAAAGEDRGARWQLHRAEARFVAGEASAVTELIEGRENLPVTSWAPTAVSGIGGRPTLLSNAETFAQLAALALGPGSVPGTPAEPGTRILSITRDEQIEVLEVAHGTPWRSVLTAAELSRPILLGGFHGQWVEPGRLRERTVSHTDLQRSGLAIGAGIVLPLAEGVCGLRRAAEIADYLAGQSARRCGPCMFGLPALAGQLAALVEGRPSPLLDSVAATVRGRGACAHPDGTARMATSAARVFAAEIAAHAEGQCGTWRRELRSA